MFKKWMQDRKTMKLFREEYTNEISYQKVISDTFDLKKIEHQLIEKYQITPKEVSTFSEVTRTQVATKIIKDAIKDNILTEEEVNTIEKSLSNLELTLDDLPKSTVNELEENYLYYTIENTPLENMVQDNINITLPKTEKCYIQQNNVCWVEQRSVTKRVNYGGVTARVKIAKGVYYRAGSIATGTQQENIWKKLDVGDFYLTNKRLIVIGNKSRNIRLNKILNIELFKDGILITKDAGKPVLLQGNLNFYALYLMLYRVLDEVA